MPLARRTFLWIAVGIFTPTAALLFLGAMIPRGFKKNRPRSAVTGDVMAEANGFPPFLVQFMAVRRSSPDRTTLLVVLNPDRRRDPHVRRHTSTSQSAPTRVLSSI